jgi:MGT family glycosyltransferase
MATIIMMPFHWSADLNVTFALAKRLQARGHRVVYLCISDVEDRIRSQGLEFRPAFFEAFPKGALEEQYSSEAAGNAAGADLFRARFSAMCEALQQGEIEKRTEDLCPDLILASSGMPWVGIAAQKTGIPAICFSSTLISVNDPIVHPFGTGLIPGADRLSALRSSLAWQALFWRRRLYAFKSTAKTMKAEIEDHARRCSYPLSRIDFRVETWPRLLMSELIFCPSAFDFPRSRKPQGAHFVEASIDVTRNDAEFPWELLADDKPLVYCSLGSVATVKYVERVAEFYQLFMDTLRDRPGLQGVVAVGSYLAVDRFSCPSNVVAVNTAPQLELLRRASVMVGHGGMSSIKESIFHGVPMVLIPLFYDQPGNVARVVYHNLGVRLPLARLSRVALGRAIDEVISNNTFVDAAQAMSRDFRAVEQNTPSIAIIESTLVKRTTVCL